MDFFKSRQMSKGMIGLNQVLSNEKLKKRKQNLINSLSCSKLESLLYYSNIILIEDMSFENTNYYLSANGFITKNLEFKSSIHNKLFQYSSCAFVVYPKTYNLNRDKVRDLIKKNQVKKNSDETHFKYSNELYNNIEIIDNKIYEPVRYGDIIMLMHYNSGKFLRHCPDDNNLRLTYQDSDYTLFQIEPASQILLNDDYVIKTGQAVKIKATSLNFNSQKNSGFYLGLQFPYEKYKDSFEKTFNKKTYKYLSLPSIKVGHYENMKWKFVPYDMARNKENLICFGSWVTLEHCGFGKVIHSEMSKQLNFRRGFSIRFQRNQAQDKEITEMLEEMNKDSDESEEEQGGEEEKAYQSECESVQTKRSFVSEVPIAPPIKPPLILYDFLVEDHKNDLSAIFVLESAIPLLKRRISIKYYNPENTFLNYGMYFRLKHFITNKFLTCIRPSNGRPFFTLVEDPLMKSNYYYESDEYVNSLFGIKHCTLTKNKSSLENNDFFRIIHIKTNFFLGYNGLKFELSENEEEKDVFRFKLFEKEYIYLMKYIGQLYGVLIYIFNNYQYIIYKSKFFYKIGKYIIKRLNKYLLNMSSNWFEYSAYLGEIIPQRQETLHIFHFPNLIFGTFIRNLWLDNEYVNIIELFRILNQTETNYHYNQFHMPKHDKSIFAIFKLTELLFEFCLNLCKNNTKIKNHIFSTHIQTIIFFVSVSKNCLSLLKELVTDNPCMIQSLLNAKGNISLSLNSSITDMYKYFFSIKKIPTGILFFSLIFDLIQISQNIHQNYSSYRLSQNQVIVSLNTKEDYFELLSKLCISEGKSNKDIQREITSKIVERSINDTFFLKETLKQIDKNKLTRFLISVSYENEDESINEAITNDETLNLDNLMWTYTTFGTRNVLTSSYLDTFIIGLTIFNSFYNSKVIYSLPKEKKESNTWSFLSTTSEKSSLLDDPRRIHFIKTFVNFYKHDIINRYFYQNKNWVINEHSEQEIEFTISFLRFLNICAKEKEKIIPKKKLKKFLVAFVLYLYNDVFDSINNKNYFNLFDETVNKLKFLTNRFEQSSTGKFSNVVQTWFSLYNLLKKIIYQKMIQKKGPQPKVKKENQNALHRMKIGERKSEHIIESGVQEKSMSKIIDNSKANLFEDSRPIPKKKNSKEEKSLDEKTIVFYNNNVSRDRSGIFQEIELANLEQENNLPISEKKVQKKAIIKHTVFTKLIKEAKYQRKINIFDNVKRMKMKRELLVEILTLFDSLTEENYKFLRSNYLLYISTTKRKIKFNDIIKECFPDLDSNISLVNSFISKFCEKSFSSITVPFNINKLSTFENKGKNFNFIHILIFLFNLYENFDLRYKIITVIVNFFSTRKKLFNFITNSSMQFCLNNHNCIGVNPFNDIEKIKKEILNYYTYYDSKYFNFHKKVNNHPNFLADFFHKNCNFIRKLLTYIKFEIRKDSLEHYNQYYQNYTTNEFNVSNIESFCTNLEQLETSPVIKEESAFMTLSSLFTFLQNNIDTLHNEYFFYFYNILRTDTEASVKMNKKFYIIFIEFVELFNIRNNSTINFNSNYYLNLISLIIIGKIFNLKKLGSKLYSTLMKGNYKVCFENYETALIIISLIVDEAYESITLDYDYVVNQMILAISNDFPDIHFPVYLTNLYIVILNKIIKYTGIKGKLVRENIEEKMLRLFTFLLENYDLNEVEKNMSLNIQFNYFKLIRHITKIDLLREQFELLLRKNNKEEFTKKFVNPMGLLTSLHQYLEENNIKGIVYVFEYFWFYLIYIDPWFLSFDSGEPKIDKIRKYIARLVFRNTKDPNDTAELDKIINTNLNLVLICIARRNLEFSKKRNIYILNLPFSYLEISQKIFELINVMSADKKKKEDKNEFNTSPYVVKRINKENLGFELKGESQEEEFNFFSNVLLENKIKMNEFIHNERKSFIYYLIYLIHSDSLNLTEYSFTSFLTKLIDYISQSFEKFYKAQPTQNKKNFCFIYSTICDLIRFFDENEKILHKYPKMKKKSLKEIQGLVEKTNIIEQSVKIVSLISKDRQYEKENEEILFEIFNLFTFLLKKGNNVIQEAFYNLFEKNSQEVENFLSFIYYLFKTQNNSVMTSKEDILHHTSEKISITSKIKYNRKDVDIICKVLQFLQLLCENHNRKLQRAMSSHTEFSKSHNLLVIIIQYLITLFDNYEHWRYSIVSWCLDCLIEFVQGPCVENQIVILKSKLLHTLDDILNVYVDKYQELNKLKITSKISFKEISLLAYKTSILLLALCENRTNSDETYAQIEKMVQRERIENVISCIYFSHLKFVKNVSKLNISSELILRELNRVDWVEEAEEDLPHFQYLIIESGFNLYYLLQYLNDYTQKETGNYSIEKIKKRNKFLMAFEDSLIHSIYKFISSMIINLIQVLILIWSLFAFILTCGHLNKFHLTKVLNGYNRKSKTEPMKFFKRNTRSIEILREDKVYKIYFLRYPFCRINKFDKTTFLENLNRESQTTKLMDIIKYANELKYELQSVYKFKQFFKQIAFIGVIFDSIELWKDLSLVLNLFQNIFNIFGVFKQGTVVYECDAGECGPTFELTDKKAMFSLSQDQIAQLVLLLSLFQCTLSCLILFDYLCRKVPKNFLVVKEEIETRYSNKNLFIQKLIFTKKFLKSTFSDFNLIYYICYATFSFVGRFSSDFFFALLLLEIVVRLKTLRNIVTAAIKQIKEVLMICIFWVILTYYCAIIAYVFFREDFQSPEDCKNLFNCTVVIFYFNNKMDNGLGGYLKDILQLGGGRFVARFFYGEIINFFIKILITQMTSGIIIDNFAVLRGTEVEMIYDMNNICTICGNNKDDINKIYSKYGKKFNNHIFEDHMIFNYVYYIIYLFNKTRTEFTGVESYVYDLVFNQKDITWFPDGKIYLD